MEGYEQEKTRAIQAEIDEEEKEKGGFLENPDRLWP